MQVDSLEIPDVKIIRPRKNNDHRGFFSETYNARMLAEAGIALEFVQDNHTCSIEPFTLRGLHYQGVGCAQDKLVRVVRGRILDVAVDIRKASPTFGKWVSAEISAEQWNQILVPAGFAHGILTLEAGTEVLYKVTDYYAPSQDFGIRWDDPDLAIDWMVDHQKVTLSDKDNSLPFFRDVVHWF